MASDLQFNKYVGALLGTVFAALGLRELSRVVFASEPPEKPGYAIAIPETAEGGDSGPALPPDWGTLLPTANVAGGATASKKCVSCHVFEKGGPNGIGPGLWGTLGARIAGHAGFDYSGAFQEYAAKAGVWTYDEMDAFLAAPQRHVPGTKMTFVGLKKQDERVNLIAYLRSMSDAPPAIPAPDPARQAGGTAPAGAPAGGSAPPGTPEGAAGVVPAPAAGTTGTPPGAQGGGGAGQTPAFGQQGGAPQGMIVSPGGEEGGRGQGSSSPGGGGTTTRPGVAASAGPAVNPQAQNPTAQPAPSTQAPLRGGPGRPPETQ